MKYFYDSITDNIEVYHTSYVKPLFFQNNISFLHYLH